MSLRFSCPIGFEGISQAAFSSQTDRYVAAIGTTGGRVRIYSMNEKDIEEVYRKKWHHSIYQLKIFPDNDEILTTSGVGGVKIHKMEGFSQCFYDSSSHDTNPVTGLTILDINRFVTGDSQGFIRMFDRRKPCPLVAEIQPEPDEDGNIDIDNDLYTINDMTQRIDLPETILSARDDGALVVHDFRMRRHQSTSDTVGYSARTIEIVKDGLKVLVGTDEGVITVFNWNEFGNICDRFPARLQRSDTASLKGSGAGWPAVEDISKVTEDIIAVATDDGVISTLNVLPNRYLSVIGHHVPRNTQGGGDCLVIDTSGDGKFVISGNPLSKDLMMHPLAESLKKSKAEKRLLKMPLSKRDHSMKKVTRIEKSSNARQLLHLKNEFGQFLSGMVESKEENEDGDSDEDDSDNWDSGEEDSDEEEGSKSSIEDDSEESSESDNS